MWSPHSHLVCISTASSNHLHWILFIDTKLHVVASPLEEAYKEWNLILLDTTIINSIQLISSNTLLSLNRCVQHQKLNVIPICVI